MSSILCISFPDKIIAGLKLIHPSLYKICHFVNSVIDSESFILIVLPVEVYISQILSLSKSAAKIITWGDQKFLEEAFLAGATDYLKTPWDHKELIFRIEKIFSSQIIKSNSIHMEITDSGLIVNSTLFRLSKREIEIMTLLSNNRNCIVNYRVLAEYIGVKSKNYENTLYVTISTLRKKLKKISPSLFPHIFDIENISSKGYLFRESVENLCKDVNKSNIVS
jgi:DNA-binding winged helix-turn-helix (wHTH) protein